MSGSAQLSQLEDVVGRIVLARPTTRLITWAWTGSRDLPVEWVPLIEDQFSLMRKLAVLHAFRVKVVHGHCGRGVDALVDRLAQRSGPMFPDRHPVTPQEWARYGGYAGPRRNSAMLRATRPDLLSAAIYRASRGSTGCRNEAISMCIPTITLNEESQS